MLNLLRKRGIEETSHAHTAKMFDTNTVADRLKRLLTSSSVMQLIETVVRSKTYTKIQDRKYSNAFTSKDPIGTVETYNIVSKSSPSRSDFASVEIPH